MADLKERRNYHPKIIAITGTNGKTTVTRLTGELCRAAGRSVKVAGNISPAALDVLRESTATDSLPDVWVLELSSFQLYSTYTLRADAATVLNISQDHLDWHGDMNSYVSAKERIFGSDTVRVLNRDDTRVMKMYTSDAQCTTFGTDVPVEPGAFGMLEEHGMRWLIQAVATDDDSEKKTWQAKSSN